MSEAESREHDHETESDRAMIAAGVVIALGLLFCVLIFLVAG